MGSRSTSQIVESPVAFTVISNRFRNSSNRRLDFTILPPVKMSSVNRDVTTMCTPASVRLHTLCVWSSLGNALCGEDGGDQLRADQAQHLTNKTTEERVGVNKELITVKIDGWVKEYWPKL